jgi:hypothetical protein
MAAPVTGYEPIPHATLRQGDIILAPSAVLVPSREGDLDAPRSGPARLGDTQRLALWEDGAGSRAPELSVEVGFSPVLVLSHDCDLEKEFNERVRELLAEGRSEAEAVEIAEGDPTLDPFAAVASLKPYDLLPPRRHAGVRAGQRIGCFPLDRLPRDGGDYFVDLGQVSTLSVALLRQDGKVASLDRDSVFELRYKLAEAYAIRDLAVLQELERMTGRAIVRAEAVPRSGKKTSLQLYLDDGDIVHLEIRKPRDELPQEIVRTRARD